jgi:protein-S-isoprenylcysteine O-methyltransferase Ste14
MDNTTDTAQVIIRPPLAWGVAVIAGLALNWLVPLPFFPAALPAGWLDAMAFVLALALFAWAIVTITRAGSNVPTNRPTTTIVDSGPYRFTRNPIYLGMFLGLIGLAITLDNLWLLMMLVPFALVIRYGVVPCEEAYLERKFGNVYRGYETHRGLEMLDRQVQLPGEHANPAAPVPSEGKARIERECPINQGQSGIDILAETPQHHGGAAEDARVVGTRSKGLSGEIDGGPAVLFSLAVIDPVVIFEIDPVSRRCS